MSNTRLVLLVETAIMAGLAYVLGLVQINFGWAYGGSISFVMVPIVILALRRGMLAGVTAGLIVGLLKLMFGGYVVHPIQAILDYPLAFLVIGLAGMVKLSPNLSKNKLMTLSVIGIVVATALRFVCHFLSGVVFFAEFAEDTPVLIYSAIYNLSYLVPEAIITAVAVYFIVVGAPQLFKPRASVSIEKS